MRKIIDKKIYDTETATMLASMSNGRHATDFTYYEAALYQTKKGNLFLFEEGGAMSKMSVYLGNNSTGGSADIRALDKYEAYEILATWQDNNDIHADDMIKVCKTIGISEPLEA